MTGVAVKTWSDLKAHFANWAIVLFGLLSAQGLSALALILLARRTSPLEYGQYLAPYNMISLLIVLPAFGMDGWLLTRGAARPNEVMVLWWSTLRLRIGLLAPWLLAMAGLAMGLPPQTFPSAFVIFSAIGLAAESLTSLTYSGLRNLSRHRWVTGFQTAGSLTLLVATLLLPLGPGRVIWFVIARMLISVVLAAVTVRWMIRSFGRPTTTLPSRSLFRSTFAFLLGDIAVSLYLRADLTIVSLFMGSNGASIYGPALNLTNMCFLVPSALYFLVVPSLARGIRHSRQVFDRLGIVQLATQTTTGILLAITMAVLARPIIQMVYGPGYEPSADILRLLSPVLALKSINFGLGALITTAGLQANRTTVQMLVAIMNVCTNLVVVQIWGITGVAIVYAISETLLCSGYLGVFITWRRSAKSATTMAV